MLKNLSKKTIVQCGVAALASVALMSWLRIRPLGILFLAVFGFWLYKTRCNLRIVPPPELVNKCEQLSARVHDWRQNKPTMFCAVSTGCLGTLAILGHLISGSTVVLIGLVIAAIISTKYNFKLVQIEPKSFDWSEKIIPRDAELEDEFLPEVNEMNLCMLKRASDLETISCTTDDEDKSDEIPSELLIPDAIPEIDEHSSDNDDDDDEHNDLVPIVRKTAKNTANNQKQQQKDDAIEFKRGHFKRDSSLSTTSSSSEESLSKGLQFPDHMASDGDTTDDSNIMRQLSAVPHNQEASDVVASMVKSQTQALIAANSKYLPSLVSGLVQWGMGGGGGGGGSREGGGAAAAVSTNASKVNAAVVKSNDANTAASTAAAMRADSRYVTALDSSDESDFEILETDDFK